MTEAERREAARKFINHWRGKGDEKQDSQLFWVSLLQDVYGMENVKEHVQFERRVIVDGQQKYIDVYLQEHDERSQQTRTAVRWDFTHSIPASQEIR